MPKTPPSWIKQKYLDAAWWADGVPPLRRLKCLVGRHAPVANYVQVARWGGATDMEESGESCGYCGYLLGPADG